MAVFVETIDTSNHPQNFGEAARPAISAPAPVVPKEYVIVHTGNFGYDANGTLTDEEVRVHSPELGQR
jgi:hypothetical protein